MISENMKNIEKNIAAAAVKAGRAPEEVQLISVSKTMPVELLREAYEAGARDFGENKVQELCDKYEQLPEDIRWHMIGHLQTNKVKYIIGKTALIHSVDSLHLAEEIEKEAVKHHCEADILLEVNIAGEESKYGLKPEDVSAEAEKISRLPHVHIRGLMTVAPAAEDPENSRVFFRRLKQLSVDIAAKNIDNVSMNVLSMGMSGDYETAVEEGASYVRVGTGIFGHRSYPAK